MNELPETRPAGRLRGLRPLLWWLLLVLGMYAYRTHERLSALTRLNFSMTLNARPLSSYETKITLDGKPYANAAHVSIGWHQLAVSHPKADAFSTNFFVWYGEHNLGDIPLKRSQGVLSVTVNPPAGLLTIRGTEFSVMLTNSSGLSTSVPTDEYEVAAQYRHWSQRQRVTVFGNTTNPLNIGSKLGALRLECNQSEAIFQLRNSSGQVMETGDFPATVVELAEGRYHMFALHHDHQWTERPEVKAGATNTVRVDIQYGAAILDTRPPGATITSGDGHRWGVTPLHLTELQPGTWRFSLRLDNYEPITVSLDITANETKTCETNLTSLSYTGAMRVARQFMAAADYEHALSALDDALRTQANDPAAIAMQREARGLSSIRRAEASGKEGDYIGGGLELKKALTFLPDNERARQMVADFKKHEPEQIEHMRLERIDRPKKIFDSVISEINGARMFESHELKASKPVEEMESAIAAQLKLEEPPFQIVRADLMPALETFRLEATQTFSGGSRRCVIVGGQSKDDETRILFTVVEYQKVSFMKQPISSLVGATPLEYTVINPNQSQLSDKSKLQIAEGVSNLTARIQIAIGQTSASE